MSFFIGFLITLAVIGAALVVFVKTSSNPVAKFLNKKLFGKKPEKKKKLDIVLMSGPAGVGKGTIIEKLMKEYPNGFAFSISHTTRAPREGETNGVQYHFVTKEEFEKMKKDGKFVECAEVHGNYYGTSKDALKKVSDTGKVAIVEIDVQGAKAFKQSLGSTSLSCVYLFFKAPSLEELRKRMEARGKDSAESIEKRIETAKKELEFVDKNESLYDRVFENKDLEETYSRLKRVLQVYGAI
jgi:guanylate kinase